MKISEISFLLTIFASISLMAVKPKTPKELAQMQKEQQTFLDILPMDLKNELSKFLKTAENLDEAIKNINNFAAVNSKFAASLNNEENIKNLIKDLARQFHTPKEIVATQAANAFPIIKSKSIQDWISTNKKLEDELFAAAYENNIEKIRKLIQVGVDINAYQRIGLNSFENILYYLAGIAGREWLYGRYIKFELIKALVEAGADPEPAFGSFVLNAITVNNEDYKNIVKWLASKVNVNIQDSNGQTPFMYITTYYPMSPTASEIISVLLQHGANLNLKDRFGKSAIDYAKQNDWPQSAIDLLEKRN